MNRDLQFVVSVALRVKYPQTALELYKMIYNQMPIWLHEVGKGMRDPLKAINLELSLGLQAGEYEKKIVEENRVLVRGYRLKGSKHESNRPGYTFLESVEQWNAWNDDVADICMYHAMSQKLFEDGYSYVVPT